MPKTSKKKISSPLFLLSIAGILTSIAAFFLGGGSMPNPLINEAKPWDYNFSYSQNGKLFVYNLGEDKTQELKPQNKIIQFSWSNSGKLAFIDSQFNLYLANLEGGEHKKLATFVKGYFFWKDDNSGIFEANYVPTGYVPEGNWQKTYFVNLDGKITEIPVKDYEKVSSEQITASHDNKTVSYDNSYRLKTEYVVGRSHPSLVEGSKAYPIPTNSRVSVSAGNSFVSFENQKSTLEDFTFQVFNMGDIKNNNLKNPVYEKMSVRDYKWLTDSEVLIVQEKDKTDDKNINVTFDYLYYLVNVRTHKEANIYTIKDTQQGLAEVNISPDLKRLAFQVEEIIGTGRSAARKYSLVVVSLPEGKELSKTPFEIGAWSEPIY